jgi:hypothetical protein
MNLYYIKTLFEEEYKKAKSTNHNNDFLKIWVCGNNFELIDYYDKDIYTKYDYDKETELFNINNYKYLFSEFSMMMYVYGNDIKSDYIGTSHYRRYLQLNKIDFNELQNDIIYHPYNYEQWTSPLECYKYQNYPYIEAHLCGTQCPIFMYDDLYNFLFHHQQIVPIKVLNDLGKWTKIHYFFNREMFCCKYEIFSGMMEFLLEYLLYISTKYDLHNFQDWYDHINNLIISHYKQNYDLLLQYHIPICFQKRYKFKTIMNKKNGYGKCNCWRIYSYMIELLISIYIEFNNYFNCHSLLYV